MPILIQSGRFGSFNPLTAITWHTAAWADDPLWTNPGDGNAVSSWRDGSGNGNTFTQGTGANQPTFRASGGSFSKPHIQFDGTDDYLSTASFTNITTETSYVAIVDPVGLDATLRAVIGTTSGTRRRLLRVNNTPDWVVFTGGDSPAGGTPAAGSIFLLSARYTATPTATVTENGTTVINAVSLGGAYENIDSLRLGAINSLTAFLGMRLAFVGFFAGNVTADANWTNFKTWAASYYGITVA